MLATIVWVIFVVGIFTLAFYQTSARNWLIVSAVLLILVTAFANKWVGIAFWVVWFLSLVFVSAPFWRRNLFSKPILHWFLRVQPKISHSEREVLEAGGIWWEKEFFTGNPDWEKLLHSNPNHLTAEEQAFLDGPVKTLCSMLNDWEITEKNDLPPAVWDYIKHERFWGLGIEKKYGGLGFSALMHSAVVTQIASRSATAALTVMVPNALGPAVFIEYFGTQQQRDYYLPRLANGQDVSCFALTSLVAGSDATSIIDSGVVCQGQYLGKEVLGICLNFSKRYITLAPVSTLIGLAFQLTDPEHLLGDKENVGITCALIPSNLKGVKIGPRHKPLTLAFMNGPIEGKDVFIPLDLVVGGAEGCGRGWKMLMECLALGRGISLPSVATAAQQLCFRASSAYSVVRHQFKRPIGEFEGIALELAKIGAYSYLSDATRVFTLRAIDCGVKPSIASAIAKYHLTELARKSVNHAMDIHGGKAIQNGPRNYLANLYNAVPVCITVEGANILTRNLIIFGQGLVRCHPYLAKEMEAAREHDNKERLKKFDKLLLKHIGFTLSRFVRTFIYGLTGGYFISSCRHGDLRYFIQQFTRMSAAFIFVTDVTLLVIGAKLKFKEALSARFGDILSHLYMGAAVIQHFEQAHEPELENPFLQWSLSYCLVKIQNAFAEILQNYPRKGLGKLLWSIVFPYGKVYQSPSDECSYEIAKLMQTPSALRDKLTQYCYVGESPESLAVLENVFANTERANTILQLIPGAMEKSDPVILELLQKKLVAQELSREDFILLENFLKQRMEIIEVDAFENGKEVNERKNNTVHTTN